MLTSGILLCDRIYIIFKPFDNYYKNQIKTKFVGYMYG
jgi:hypothetical protein